MRKENKQKWKQNIPSSANCAVTLTTLHLLHLHSLLAHRRPRPNRHTVDDNSILAIYFHTHSVPYSCTGFVPYVHTVVSIPKSSDKNHLCPIYLYNREGIIIYSPHILPIFSPHYPHGNVFCCLPTLPAKLEGGCPRRHRFSEVDRDQRGWRWPQIFLRCKTLAC